MNTCREPQETEPDLAARADSAHPSPPAERIDDLAPLRVRFTPVKKGDRVERTVVPLPKI
jgi:hypothetical protein